MGLRKWSKVFAEAKKGNPDMHVRLELLYGSIYACSLFISSLVVLAGDVSPIDVLSHLPVFCEENTIPYVFVPSKSDLGMASSTKRPTCCILVTTPPKDSEYEPYYTEAVKKVRALVQ